ncbi:MAG: TM1812 family CRISPR-associated protein [Oscillospiraceae bacterium]|nr:TM1812 family CRISPR-associated protein [Oscillospiraceae bacterium]
MKRFFTSIPLQVGNGLAAVRYQAVDNKKLQTDFDTCFPILTAINGYVNAEEPFAVVSVIPDSGVGRENYRRLTEELAQLCGRKGLRTPEMVCVEYAEDMRVGAMTELFLKLSEQVKDDDELYSCVTFGTKLVSTVMILAVQYGYQVRKNVTIDGIVYGEISRPDPDPASWKARVYDETGLLQLEETARLLAQSGVRDPSAAIRGILNL